MRPLCPQPPELLPGLVTARDHSAQLHMGHCELATPFCLVGHISSQVLRLNGPLRGSGSKRGRGWSPGLVSVLSLQRPCWAVGEPSQGWMEPLSRIAGWQSQTDTQASGTQGQGRAGCLISERIIGSVTAGISWDQLGSPGSQSVCGGRGA